MPLAVPEIVLQIVILGLQRVEGLVLVPPPDAAVAATLPLCTARSEITLSRQVAVPLASQISTPNQLI